MFYYLVAIFIYFFGFFTSQFLFRRDMKEKVNRAWRVGYERGQTDTEARLDSGHKLTADDFAYFLKSSSDQQRKRIDEKKV